MSDWLKELQVGDKVIVCGNRLHRKVVRRVEKLTKTQIVLSGTSTRYRRESGYQVGGDIWDKTSIARHTDEQEQAINEANEIASISSKLGRVVWHKLPLATLRAIAALIEEGE